MRSTLKHIRAHLTTSTPISEAVSSRARAGIYLGRLGVRILRQWARDRCPQQAAALAFQTVLSVVPVLAVAFALMRATGATGAEERLLQFVARNVLPQMDDVVEQLHGFADRISTGAIGASGLMFTLVTCYTLYGSVERIWNDIWKSTRKRSALGRFLTFYALVTLVPFLAGSSLYWSGKLILVGGAAQILVPLLIQFVALLITNKLLPTTYVTWRAALIGATVTSLALEGLKLSFVAFAKRVLLASYSLVYGTVGLLPMLLVWIYTSWLLVLLGAEIANAFQNQRLLEAEDRRRAGEEPINGLVATQILAAIAAEYARGGRGLTRVDLAQAFGLTPQGVEVICARLKERGLVAEVAGDKEGFIPGRDPRSIGLDDVLGAFRSGDLQVADGITAPALADLVHDLEATRRQRIAGVTLADLLPSEEDGRLAPEEIKASAG